MSILRKMDLLVSLANSGELYMDVLAKVSDIVAPGISADNYEAVIEKYEDIMDGLAQSVTAEFIHDYMGMIDAVESIIDVLKSQYGESSISS